MLLLAAGSASAGSLAGGGFPPTLAADGRTLVLNGVGKRVVAFLVDAYASGLYLPEHAHDVAAILAEPGPKLLLTRFLHAASAAQARAEFTAIHDDFCAANRCGEASRANFARVLGALQPVQPGDTAGFLLDGDLVTFSRNGRPVLVFRDPDYAGAMLRSLLGPASPTGAYRRGLLGGG